MMFGVPFIAQDVDVFVDVVFIPLFQGEFVFFVVLLSIIIRIYGYVFSQR